MTNYIALDKLDWLKETCSRQFIEETLMPELVRWMGEREFEEFYDHLCRNWDIKRDPNDPNFDPERDSLDG